VGQHLTGKDGVIELGIDPSRRALPAPGIFLSFQRGAGFSPSLFSFDAWPASSRAMFTPSREPGLTPGLRENLLLFARKFLPSFWGLVAFSSFP
jgi:hypothetical protein